MNWLTLGIPKGIINEGRERFERANESGDAGDYANWLLLGLPDLVKGTVQPEKALSFEHWMNSIALASILYGGYRAAKNALPQKPNLSNKNDINYKGSTESLMESATVEGKRGVTPVGRAFQKHAGNPNRAGSFTGQVSGNALKNTEQGTLYLNAILKDPSSTYTVRHTTSYGTVLDVRLPDGTGARWTADGHKFIGFLEKYSQ